MSEGKFVAYYRVSTDRQGQSGLGLEAQQKAVSDYLNGGNWELIGEFTEVETGTGSKPLSKRLKLAAAIKLCRKHKAKLVIAKLDRLARNVHFISGLMEAGIEFIAADNPNANRLTSHILCAVAEDETDRISKRTKAALAAAKARGVVLGKNGKVLAEKHKAEGDTFARSVAPAVRKIQKAGAVSARQVTAELNRQKIPTAKGKAWNAGTTHRLLRRLDLLAASNVS